ncbi:MAG: DUF4124 domain-containing protein [Chromatiales bacterium]|jgi:hypothetical protein|nr:DUF4124 domain-containing protein [Chromatiales bacterium]
MANLPTARTGGSHWLRAGVVALLAATVTTGALAAEPRKRAPRKPSTAAAGSTVYKWTDDRGVVHYGDQIPPEFAREERVVLNSYGVPLETQYPVRTAEQIAAEKLAADARAAEQAALQRDQILLSTYLSVDEILALRDRRVELLGGQIQVTENYLATLRTKLKSLQAEAAAFKPYSTDPAADAIDTNLAAELADTLDSVDRYEKTLADIRAKQVKLVAAFEADANRFRELKQQASGAQTAAVEEAE